MTHRVLHQTLIWFTATVTCHKPQSGQNGKQQPPKVTSSPQPLLDNSPLFSFSPIHLCCPTNRLKCHLNVKPDSHRTSLEGPSLHPEFGEGGPGVVKRRVRHTSSAVGRPAGTGARSHWSSGTQRGEEGGEKERAEGERRDGGRGVERERERERD